jgi:hypothetical protein
VTSDWYLTDRIVTVRHKKRNRRASMDSVFAQTVQAISHATGFGTTGSILLIGLALLYILYKIIDKA